MRADEIATPKRRIGRITSRLATGRKDRGIDGLAAAIGQPVPEHAGRIQNVPIELIDLDDQQVRKLGLSLSDVQTGVRDNDPHQTTKRQALESIKLLADSIDQSGLIQPITLVKRAERFTILIGERRFLAHCLLNRQHIYSIVASSEKSAIDKTTVQLVENIQHEKLSLHDLASSLMEFGETYQHGTGENPGYDDIQKRFGLARSTTYQYLKVINTKEAMREPVLAAIADGSINTLIRLAELCSLSKKDFEAALAPSAPQQTRYSMGSTSNTNTIRTISEILEKHLTLTGVEPLTRAQWDEPKAVQKHWKKLLSAVEQQCE